MEIPPVQVYDRQTALQSRGKPLNLPILQPLKSKELSEVPEE